MTDAVTHASTPAVHTPDVADKDRWLAAIAIAHRRLPPTIAHLIAAEISFFLQHPWLGAQPQLRALISELEQLDQKANR